MLYSIRSLNQTSAILNICSLLFVIGVLFFSIYFMNKDFSSLILTPLERMLQRIREVSLDPMQIKK